RHRDAACAPGEGKRDPGPRSHRARRGRRPRRRPRRGRGRLPPEAVRVRRAAGPHPCAPPPSRVGRRGPAPGRGPRARRRPLRGQPRREPARPHRKGVLDPRVLHAARGRARDPQHAAGALLGRELRGALEPRRRAREPGAPEGRRAGAEGALPDDSRRRLHPRRAGVVIALRSLRVQLVLGFAALASFVVLAAGIAAVALIRHAVWAPPHAALGAEAETLNPGVAASAGDRSAAAARIGSETNLGGGKFIRILARDGREIARWGDVPAAVAALPLPGARGEGGATVGDDHDAARVVRYLAPDGTWT